MSTFRFGKHKGESLVSVAESDPEYCQWVCKNTQASIVSELESLIDLDAIYLTFGKHKNKTLNQVAEDDPKYIEYLKQSAYIKDKRQDILDWCLAR